MIYDSSNFRCIVNPETRIGGEKLENPHLQGGQLGNGLVPGARVEGDLGISRHG